ncbi:MAG TPA: tetratricopeptide repeat protein [Polyangia bacterium]
MKTVLSMVALAAFTFVIPAVAHAQDSDDAEVTKMAKEHYMLGLDAYKAGKYDVAIKELKKAYLLKRLPALLLNIGATYRKMGDLDLALHFYQKYIDEAPPDAKDRDDVQKTIAEIQAEKQNGAQAAQGTSETATPPPEERPAHHQAAKMPHAWSHTVIDAAPPDTPIDVRVQMPVMRGVKVWVYYRGTGEANYTPVLMKRHGPEKVGRIPGDAVNGRAIQYYIEAKDPSGTVVKSSGSEISPNVVLIDPSAPPQVMASLDQDSEQRAQQSASEDQSEDQEQPPTRRGDEEEAPPLTGQVSGRHARHHEARQGASKFGSVFWAGLAIGAVGVGALAGGVGLLAAAKSKADSLSSDSQLASQNGNMYYFNNDPQAGSTDADYQKTGKLYNNVGIALSAIGGVALAGGVIMMIVDQTALHHSEEKPTHHRRRRVEPDEESSIRNLYVAPAAGPGYAGVGGGFQF